jgi:hypothetical protein
MSADGVAVLRTRLGASHTTPGCGLPARLASLTSTRTRLRRGCWQWMWRNTVFRDLVAFVKSHNARVATGAVKSAAGEVKLQRPPSVA